MSRPRFRIPPPRRAPAHLANRHPITSQIALDNLASQFRTLKVALFTTPDGAEELHLLAGLAWMLTLAACVEFSLHGPTPRGKHVHGALRNIVQVMCLRDGYRWNADLAHATEAALQVAHDLLLEHAQHMDLGLQDAQLVQDLIKGKAVKPDTVAGAELYALLPQLELAKQGAAA